MQLRYYFGHTVTLRQISAEFQYSYEYLGNSNRLVRTPLTMKVFLTMTRSLHLYYGGSPQGPAGTGKTETIKDLAKAMGQYCLVFNCSDRMDVKTMARFFQGLSQCGAWSCLDEFNRIEIEVLSVVAMQFQSIIDALRIKAEFVVIEQIPIPLRRSIGVFVTMNPHYLNRKELPDNLKALFRPIAMIVPDQTQIAENILYSDGTA